MIANEELASEVDKLYKAEDQQLREREKLMKELKETRDQTELEKKQLNQKLQEEKNKLEIQINQLHKSLEITKLENEKLDSNRKNLVHPLPHLQKVQSSIYFCKTNIHETLFRRTRQHVKRLLRS
jgi:chromosome segregation ATPase